MIAVNPDRTRCPYEVGDILQTINSTPPAQRWPGTQWQQITDRFVRGADSQHPAGSTGGSWTHTLTKNELPNVNLLWRYEDNPGHYLPHGVTAFGIQRGETGENLVANGVMTDTFSATSEYGPAVLDGGGQPMDITNPYYSAYIWLRTR